MSCSALPVRLLIATLALLVTLPAAADTFSLDVSPFQPSFIESFVIFASVESSNVYEVESFSMTGSQILINLRVPGPCLITCPPTLQTFEFEVDPLPQGSYDILLLAGGQVRTQLTVQVVGTVDHVQMPRLQAVPATPTDNDRVRVAIPWIEVPCIYSEPVVDRIERPAPDDVRIYLRTSYTDSPPPCPPSLAT